ncbi:4'-phosphopantetheinyl transferase family protein [Gracilimonas amylolytica]|uniref:4'-phosphopantetheinyl transferase family protein n=1 Tax=Gracilimonas amylolytica TaxID=1749045 RepID=UPI000CD97560|nr:4'-phosphopantetheinyl transferase superfamily protein [Gracilimonas amylolytica]
MQIIDTSHIEGCPSKVTLGCAAISDDYTTHILSEKEKAEYRQFKNPGRQAEYLTARHLFRFIAGKLELNIDVIQLYKEEGGKPFATEVNKHLFVSFTHSEDKVFCAISESLDIGVDAERLSRRIPQRVLDRVLNETEKQALKELKPLQIWTLKEAAVKCLGTGLRTNLNEVVLSIKDNGEISTRFNNDKFIEICSFKATDHQIALAYHSTHI